MKQHLIRGRGVPDFAPSSYSQLYLDLETNTHWVSVGTFSAADWHGPLITNEALELALDKFAAGLNSEEDNVFVSVPMVKRIPAQQGAVLNLNNRDGRFFILTNETGDTNPCTIELDNTTVLDLGTEFRVYNNSTSDITVSNETDVFIIAGDPTGQMSFKGHALFTCKLMNVIMTTRHWLVTLDMGDFVNSSAATPLLYSDKDAPNGVAGLDSSGRVAHAVLADNSTKLAGLTLAEVITEVQFSSGQSAPKWTTARTLTVDGALNGQVTFDGSANVLLAVSLPETGVVAGTYPKVTVGATGLVSAGSFLTTADIPNLSTSKITSGVLADARLSGTYSAVSIGGNAETATKLKTPRAINGVNFDGTADISVFDNTKEPAFPGGGVGDYLNGLKGWSSLSAAVRGIVLSGFLVSNAGAVTNTDFLEQAISKIQGQLNLLNAVSDSDVGLIEVFATQTPPAGRLKANGAEVSRTLYKNLFDMLVTNSGFVKQTVTATIGTPGVFTKAAHGLYNGARVRLFTTGVLPTGLVTTIDYYVEVIDVDKFYLLSSTGVRVITSGTQSGTHQYLQSWFGLGNGTTTFNLPDLRGEFLRGWDDGRGVDAGRAFASFQADGLKSHSHQIKSYNSGGNTGYTGYTASAGTLAATAYTLNTELAGGTETRPRNIALLICIKY